ncbi:hypothetical protein HaLaN_30308 [Haematococcus lacustris]|uniref:Uncharacterized protein n=1 Tax=Haematococcus lacustris TaxID=44745 RepID=A0A6A0AF62_HAELA|nr:hypothetical protein HaLaN_30308 [Haematococcus lacustris]
MLNASNLLPPYKAYCLLPKQAPIAQASKPCSTVQGLLPEHQVCIKSNTLAAMTLGMPIACLETKGWNPDKDKSRGSLMTCKRETCHAMQSVVSMSMGGRTCMADVGGKGNAMAAPARESTEGISMHEPMPWHYADRC